MLSQQVSITAEAEALEGQQHLTASKPAPMYRYPDAQPVSAYTLGYALYASDVQPSGPAGTSAQPIRRDRPGREAPAFSCRCGLSHLTASKPAPMYRYPDAQPVSAYTLGYALYASDVQGKRQLNAQTMLTASGGLPGTFSSSFSSHAGDVWVGRPALFSSPAWLEKLLLNVPGNPPDAVSMVWALSWRFPCTSLA